MSSAPTGRMRRSIIAALATGAMMVGSATADLVSIEYFDRAGPSFPGSGGPLWTGVVDTVTNNLRIDTWNELPGHGIDFWTPANLPMIWNAVDANGLEFDVPDTFGVGGVVDFGSDLPANAANDFAFISPVSMQSLDWHPFNSTTGEPDTSLIVNFTGSVTFFPGWGGYAFIHPINGTTFLVAEPSGVSADDFDYRSVPALPISDQGIGASTAATVTVTGRTVTDVPTIIAIPEASAVTGFVLIAGTCAAIKLRRRLKNSAAS